MLKTAAAMARRLRARQRTIMDVIARHRHLHAVVLMGDFGRLCGRRAGHRMSERQTAGDQRHRQHEYETVAREPAHRLIVSVSRPDDERRQCNSSGL